jgi:hypothetical protein
MARAPKDIRLVERTISCLQARSAKGPDRFEPPRVRQLHDQNQLSIR